MKVHSLDMNVEEEPLDSTHLTQGQRNRRYIPIDEAPDTSLNPFEALVEKEELMRKQPQPNDREAKSNDDVGLEKPEPPEPFDWEQHYRDGVCETQPPPFEDLTDDAERSLSCKRSRRRDVFWIILCQSHGIHGRRPHYKDKFSQTVRY